MQSPPLKTILCLSEKSELGFLCFFTFGVASCHCVALDAEGRCYTWGRNEAWMDLSCEFSY